MNRGVPGCLVNTWIALKCEEIKPNYSLVLLPSYEEGTSLTRYSSLVGVNAAVVVVAAIVEVYTCLLG